MRTRRRLWPTAYPGRRKLWAVQLLLLVGLLWLATGPALADETVPGAVLVLHVRGVIDPVVAQYVVQSLADARAADARLVIIQLDTPGGLDSAMRDMVQAILNSQVPVAVFVAPAGARAASAGVFITMAAHVAAMAPGTNIGAAHPVAVGQDELSDTMERKATNDAVAYIQAIAQERGRNATLAADMVRRSVSVPAQQALEEKIVDLMARDMQQLVAALDGYQVTLGDRPVRLALSDAPLQERTMSWLQVFAHGIVDPNIAYILFTLGTTALIAEFWNPGAIVPGVVGAICIVLAFVAFGSLPVNWGGFALIILAFVFFILDIKVSGFALSLAGGVSFVLGSLLLFSPFNPELPAMPQLSVEPWLLAGMTVLLVAFFGVVLTAGWRAQRAASLLHTHVPVGAIGVVVSDLDPQGVVYVNGETWTAVSSQGPLRSGEAVQVVGSEGLRLTVRRPNSDIGNTFAPSDRSPADQEHHS